MNWVPFQVKVVCVCVCVRACVRARVRARACLCVMNFISFQVKVVCVCVGWGDKSYIGYYYYWVLRITI